MNERAENRTKYGNRLFVLPKKKKEIAVFIMMLIVILFGVSPVINLANTPSLIFGVPSVMVLAVLVPVLIVIVLSLARKWGVK